MGFKFRMPKFPGRVARATKKLEQASALLRKEEAALERKHNVLDMAETNSIGKYTRDHDAAAERYEQAYQKYSADLDKARASHTRRLESYAVQREQTKAAQDELASVRAIKL